MKAEIVGSAVVFESHQLSPKTLLADDLTRVIFMFINVREIEEIERGAISNVNFRLRSHVSIGAISITKF